jgi:hypothetical protein
MEMRFGTGYLMTVLRELSKYSYGIIIIPLPYHIIKSTPNIDGGYKKSKTHGI